MNTMEQDGTILKDVAAYYSAKLAEHGETARGVDWNGEESQTLRFAQLTTVIQDQPQSLNDLGCGYGALLDYLRPSHPELDYRGCDVSADMIAVARKRHAADPRATFVHAGKPEQAAEYGIASGIFNIRLDCGDDEWQRYLEATLDELHATSTRGFAFNCLTSYSDADRMRSHLYYADPLQLFDLCKRRYARNVALLHDYGLFEFTIIVRKA